MTTTPTDKNQPTGTNPRRHNRNKRGWLITIRSAALCLAMALPMASCASVQFTTKTEVDCTDESATDPAKKQDCEEIAKKIEQSAVEIEQEQKQIEAEARAFDAETRAFDANFPSADIDESVDSAKVPGSASPKEN